MNVIFKYHLRQIYNFWRSLGLRIQIEIIILFVIFYTFFSGKLKTYFFHLLDQPNVTEWGLNGFVVHGLLIIALVTTPFIYFNLIPKQKGIKVLFTQPLSGSQALSSLLLYYLKYELILIFLLTPVFTALFISTGILTTIYGIVIFISLLIYSIIIIYYLSTKSEKKSYILIKYFSLILGYLCGYYVLYWHTDIALYADLAVIICSYFLLRNIWRSHWHIWDETINRSAPVLDRSTKNLSGIKYSDLSFVRPESIKPLYIKDFLSQLRNKHYVRLKIFSLFLFITTLLIVEVFFTENFLPALSAFSIILIWEHYSHQFNEKYSTREPRYFYKVLPISFFQVILAKFVSEFMYILVIILILSTFLAIHKMSLTNIFIFSGMVFIISAFILYLMILVRTLFYDNPRFAGYAYHLMIIFSAVMILNFHLVGPIVTIGILIYLNIKSYRQFIS